MLFEKVEIEVFVLVGAGAAEDVDLLVERSLLAVRGAALETRDQPGAAQDVVSHELLRVTG